MEDFIILLIVTFIVGATVVYLRKAKKRGEKCIGCPYAKQCSGRCNGVNTKE